MSSACRSLAFGSLARFVAFAVFSALIAECAAGSSDDFLAPQRNSEGNFEDCGGISVRRQLNDVITWQSAAMHGTCLWHRRQSGSGVGAMDYWFHTGYAASFITEPFHWLVIKLPAPILMLKITARFELRHYMMLAAIGGNFSSNPAAAEGYIEALVSPDDWDLGDEHCQSSGFSAASDRGWRLCARLLPPSQSLTGDYWCREPGGALVRTLLLRKAITANTQDRFMSFADLILRQAFYVSAQPSVVLEGHRLAVECASCSSDVTGFDPSQLVRQHKVQQQLLCLRPEGGEESGDLCVQQRLLVPTAEPSHAGIYQCRHPLKGFNASARVRVLYGPASLKIDYTIRRTHIDESSSESPVGEAQRRLAVKLEIRFATSDAYPLLSHLCTALVGKRNITLTKSVTGRTSIRGAMESVWLASLTGSNGQLTETRVTARCTATQTFESDGSGGLYRGRFGLHRRIRLQPESTTADTPQESHPTAETTRLGTITVVCVAAPIMVALAAILALSCAARRTTRLRQGVPTFAKVEVAPSLTTPTTTTQCGCFTNQQMMRSSLQQQRQQQLQSTTSGTYEEPVLYIN